MKGKSIFTREEALLITSLIQEKLKANSETQKGIRDKIRKIGFYASDFNLRGGYTVEDFLRIATVIGDAMEKPVIQMETKPASSSANPGKRAESDEAYVLDICDEVLLAKGLRQYRFDFLKGDAGTKLPVDIYYPNLNLVIEYREKQHTEEVKLFDRRMTVSGTNRGQQRRKYDALRRREIPKHGLTLIEVDYSEFAYTKGKRLLRNREEDVKIISEKLKNFIRKR